MILEPVSITLVVDPESPVVEVVPVAGPTGQRGPAGSGGDAVELAQTSPSASWIFAVPDTFGRRPAVAIYDPTGVEVEADVTADSTTVNVSFPAPVTGSVVLT